MDNQDPQYINVPLGKGTILRLPVMQYAAAIKRGKQWQRAQQHAMQAARMEAAEEARRLEWIDNA